MSSTEASLRTPAPTAKRFAPQHRWDRNFFLLWVALIWLGVLMGFVPLMATQIQQHQSLPFRPLIVPIHGLVFLGWLTLLTAQVLLIRSRRVDLHRKLGIAGVVLAPVMVILGIATALIVNRVLFGEPGRDPPFIAIEFTDMLAFTGLAGAAFLLIKQPAAHKRLILLATLYISDAGFARWLGPTVAAHVDPGSLWGFMAVAYLSNDLLALGLGAYDWITRRRLHPAYIAGIAWTAAVQLTGASLNLSPAWKPIALRLIGH